MTRMTGADAVVVGAGAAGIAAARTLHDAGLDVLLVEAKDRLGGRAHSVTLAIPDSTRPRLVRGQNAGARVDLGCGWLHSARRNPWTGLAERYGLGVDRTPSNWGEQWRNLGFPPAEHAAFGAAWDRWQEAAHAALDRPDRALGDFIAPGDPWRPLIDAISGYANGAALDTVSLHDWAAYEDASTEDNWAVREGYGTLVSRHAHGLPLRLNTAVSLIDHRAAGIRVATDHGTLTTRHVIVCVPTTTLAREAIRFDPPLPAKHEAAAALPLGLADKIFLHLAGDDLPPANAHLVGNPHSACTASYRLAALGQPIVEVFLGGPCAELLEERDDRAAAAFAIDELAGLLGSGWRARFALLVRTRWRHDPQIGGSYSHARVGQAGQRAVLAAPVDGRLFFAGEACSRRDFSTAHGAYQSGIDAADALLAARAPACAPETIG